MSARQGTSGRLLWIPEDTAGADPASPLKNIVPLSAKNGFKNTQPLNPAKIFVGNRKSKGSFLGMISATGAVPISLDFKFLGRVIDDLQGHSVYTRITVGSVSLHRWVGVDKPRSVQLQAEHQDPTAVRFRHREVYPSMFEVGSQASGQATYNVTLLGVGDQVFTDVGGTEVDYGPFVATNYFDGSLAMDGVEVNNADAFSFKIDNHLTGKDAFFKAGKLAAVNFGVQEVSGTLGKIFDTADGNAFYLQAVNQTLSKIEFLYANAPLSGSPTAYCRVIIPTVKFSRDEPAVGGEEIEDSVQQWFAQEPAQTLNFPAHITATLPQPYVFDGTHKVYSVKFQGGATIDVTGAVASKTAAEAAAELNADGTFFAAGLARDIGGHLVIESRDTTSSSSAQWQVATTNSAHTVLGIDGTTWTEYAPSMIYIEILNDKLTDY